MKTKLLTIAALTLLASSAIAASPTYLYRLYSPGMKGVAAAPADPLLPTASSVFATWNPADKGTKMTLSLDMLTAVSTNQWNSVRATQGKSSGKWYWESTISGTTDTAGGYMVGAGSSTFVIDYLLGGGKPAADSLGWWPTDAYTVYWPGTTGAAGTNHRTYPVGTTFMMALDMDNHAIYLGVNGTWNSSGVPTSGATKTGAALAGFTGTVFPAVSSFSTQSTSNFGAAPFKYAVPTGYHAGVFQ